MKKAFFRICAIILAIVMLVSVMPMSAFSLTPQEQEDFYRVNTWWQNEYNQLYIDWLLESDNFVYHLDISTGSIIHDISYSSLNLDPKQRKDNFVEILTSFIGLSYDEIREQSAAEAFSDISVEFLDGFKDFLEDTQLYTVDQFKYMKKAINETSNYYLSHYYGIDTDMGEYGYQAIYERIQSAFDNNVQDFDWPDRKGETLREFYNFVNSSEWHSKLSKASDIFDALGDSVELAKDGIALIGELESYNKTDEKLVELLKYIRAKTSDSALRAACDEIIAKFGTSYTQNIVRGVLEIAADTTLEWAYDEVKDLIVDKCGIYGIWAKIGIVAGNAVSDLWFNTTETKQQMQTIYCLNQISELLVPLLKTELQDLYSYDEASSFRASYAADAIYHMSVLIELRKKGEESYYKLKDSVYGSSIIEACKTFGWGNFANEHQTIEAWYSEFTNVISAIKGSLYMIIPTQYYYEEPELTDFEIENFKLVSYNGTSSSVYLPTSTAKADYHTIAQYAFQNNKMVESVYIPYTVKTIEANAFYNCINLKSITINSLDIVITDKAFYNCHKDFTIYGYNNSTAQTYAVTNGINFVVLDNEYQNSQDYVDSDFVIENGVLIDYLGDGGDVYIPYGVTSIGAFAFYNCDSLISITISNSVTSIGRQAFQDCSRLTSITLPDGVTSISSGSFSHCRSLITITIPDSVKSIGDCAFYNCDSLTSITLLDSVTSIGESAFEGCSSLTSITIPDSLTSIGAYAFEDCSRLTSITIPDSVISIGHSAFYNCDSLTKVYITDITAWCNTNFKGSYSNPLSFARNLYLNGELVTELVIPDSVTSIGGYVFDGCSSLTSITIPDSVTSIGYGAFQWCKFTSVTIPNGVTSIDGAFQHCSALTNVTIPDSVTSIDGAFRHCSALTNVTIPDSVTSIGAYTFYDCASLTSITIPDSVTSIGAYAFEDCSRLTSITIPDSVTSIGSYAFNRCSALKNVYITDIVAWCNIDFKDAYSKSNPLYYAKNLYLNDELVTNLVIPNGVASIAKHAFDGYSSLTSITIPDSVTSIGYGAFCYCTLLTSIAIPGSVTNIDDFAFNKCNSLSKVDYYGTKEEWNNISIGSYNDYLIGATRYYHSLGDLNSDGELNLLDLVKLKKILAGVEDSGERVPDLDSDGDITAKDVVVLIDMILADNKQK